ncbi:MAG: bifunctional diaminohydroxyphosphoribosylaminopyrimidine deaminase/5-amino-6-(5-phosphoribosylamino)uracil reductase RibD [Rhodospirillaceae bacterium]|nr:bifunctional diaminohydroxyphosphoribosylaminopyrimidine deaminase/5-amino-6-(5-phosphoribosylamino)uracil reductase RibD [Rhodospirillaceae bacterium]
MAGACALAERGLGQVWPNPAVGCVLVDGQGRIVGRGHTQPGGRPHAETVALARAGGRARGSTAYVTLEPCSHTGETGPCADALVAAGISRCVVSMVDPDPRVSGRGIERMRAAGIAVAVGQDAERAAAINAGFLSRVLRGRPHVILKLATTLDGRIATHTGASRWITGEDARRLGHGLRAQADAILVGSLTAIADDPELTCRLPGLAHRSPVRIVVDSHLRLPLTARIVATARSVPTWIVTLETAQKERADALRGAGVDVLVAKPGADAMVDLGDALARLAERGLTRVLVEGGARLAATLLRGDLVDDLVWFRAPTVMGHDGVAAVAGLGVDQIADLARFERVDMRAIGDDVMEHLRLTAA